MKILIGTRIKYFCKRYFKQNTPINSQRTFKVLRKISTFFYSVENIPENFLVIRFKDNSLPNVVFCYNRTNQEKYFRIYKENAIGQSFSSSNLLDHIRALRAYNPKTFRAISQSLMDSDFRVSLQHSV